MIEDLVMKDDIGMIIELIKDKGYDLDEETISSLTKYVETNFIQVFLNYIFHFQFYTFRMCVTFYQIEKF